MAPKKNVEMTEEAKHMQEISKAVIDNLAISGLMRQLDEIEKDQ